jgi:hypothetical protein
MASPQNALDYAKRFVGRVPLDDTEIKLRMLDDAHKKLWMAAPWRWTVATGEIVSLVNDTQDYNLTALTDFLYISQASYTNGQEKNDLVVASVLPAVTTQLKGRPSQVSFVDGSPQKLRFLPVPSGYAAGAAPKVLWVYKKQAVDIASGNVSSDYNTTFGIPDEWFWVYQEIVLLKAYQFTNSPKTGGVTVANGAVQYSGQFGVV